MPFLAPALIAIGAAVQTAAVAAGVFVSGAVFAATGSGALALAASTAAEAAVPTIIEGAALAGLSALISPFPKVNTAGSPQDFKPNPNAGLPVVMGRYGVGGNLVYETTSGGGNSTAAGAKGNEYLTSFVVLSALGPVQAFETLRFNDTILTFDPNGQACNGGYIPEDEVQAWNPGYRHQNSDGSYVNNNYQDRAWQNLQLGSLSAGYFAPPDKLASDNAGLPEWTPAHGFSSFCAAALTLVYDQRYYAGGVPQYQWVLQGIKTYDPRLDTTYPGGAGAQRWAGLGASAAAIAAARASWTFSQNPWVHALNFALGYFLPDAQTGPGRLYAGIGAGVTGVDVPAFVRAANIADANDWLICGQWTTGDGKWSVLTEMAKAGSGSIVVKNGIISCIVDTPLTSLGTVTADDLAGPITLTTGSSFTARLNTIFPRFTSEAHRWQMVQADTPVKAATYVAEDGAVRSKTLDWQYVPAVNQACQLAAYTITNGREIPGIVLPGKPKLRNYDVGDCFTLDVPEAGLATTKVMVTKRVTDWSTGGVTLTVRTETDAKHAYSLGISGVAPATPGISGYDPTIVEAPLPDFWATGLLEASDPVTGESRSIINVTGTAGDNIYAKFVDIRWRPVAQVGGVWTPTGNGSWSYTQQSALQGQYPLDLNPGSYDVQIAYTTVSGAYPEADEDWLDLGVETVGGSTAANTANVGPYTAAEVAAAIAAASANPNSDPTVPATLSAPSATFSTTVDATGALVVTMTGTTAPGTDANIAGYEFGLTLAPAAQLPPFATTTDSFSWQVPAGVAYSLVVRAVKFSGVRGQWSAATTGTTSKNTTPPAAPANFTVTPGLNSNILQWTNPPQGDTANIVVYAGSDSTFSDASQIATVNVAAGLVGTYTDLSVTAGTPRYYWIEAVNSSGTPSSPAGPKGSAALQIPAAAIAGVNASTIVGLVQAAQIQAVNVSAILAGALPTGVTVPATSVSGTLTSAQIASVNAAVVSGQLAAVNIPGIDASKIISGTIPAAVAVPTVNLSGQIAATQLQDGSVLASKLASGAAGNLLADPTFIDPGYWATPFAAAQVRFDSNSSDAVFTQLGVSRAILTNSPGSTPGAFLYEQSSLIPVEAGRTYRFGASHGVCAGYNGIPYTQIVGYAGDKTFASWSQGIILADYRAAASPTTHIDVLDAVATIPSNVAYVALQFGTIWPSSSPAGYAWIAKPVLQKAVDAGAIVAGAVTASKINTADLYANNIGAQIIQAGTLNASVLTAGSITATQIAASSITSAQIAAGTIVASNIAAGTITGNLIAGQTITGSNVIAGSLTADLIQAGSITATQLAIGVSGNLIPNGNSEIQGQPGNQGANIIYYSGAPTGSYVRSLTNPSTGSTGYAAVDIGIPCAPGDTFLVTALVNSLSSSAHGYISGYFANAANTIGYGPASATVPVGMPFFNGANTWTQVGYQLTAPPNAALFFPTYTADTAAGQVLFDDLFCGKMATGALIVNGTITATNIAAQTITSAQIAARTILASNIVAGTITANEILAGSITADRIQANSITSSQIQAGSISADRIQAGSITSTQIQAGSIIASSLSVSTLSAISANLGTITAGLLSSNGGQTFFDLGAGYAQFYSPSGYVTRIGNLGSGIPLWVGVPSVGAGGETDANGTFAVDPANGNIFFNGSIYLSGTKLAPPTRNSSASVRATGLASSSTSDAVVYSFTVPNVVSSGGVWQSSVIFGNGATDGTNLNSNPSSGNVSFNWYLYEHGTGVLLNSGTGQIVNYSGEPAYVANVTSNPGLPISQATGTVTIELHMSMQAANQSFADMAAGITVLWTPGS